MVELAMPSEGFPISENMFGMVLEQDLSSADIMADPLINHYSAANHFMDYDLTMRKSRLAIKAKLLFRSIFKRKPHRVAKRAAYKKARAKIRHAKKQVKVAKKEAKAIVRNAKKRSKNR